MIIILTYRVLAEEFKKQFICSEEHTEKCITLQFQ